MNAAGRLGVYAAAAVAGSSLACPAPPFACDDDSECKVDTVNGFCEDNQSCSFPAADCPSGRRYGEHAGSPLAGTCVPGDGAATATGTTTMSPEPGDTSGGTPPSTTDAVDGTETDATTEAGSTQGMTGDSESSGSSPGSSSGSSTGAPEPVLFTDDFERPDSPSLGNGWVERTPGVFALQNGRVVAEGSSAGYPDSVFYRPFADQQLDVELSIEFEYVAAINFSTPQLHARIQEDSLDVADNIDCYIVYLSQPDRIAIARIDDADFAESATQPIEPPLVQGEVYRLRFGVAGTDPVEMIGAVDVLEDGAWVGVQTVFLTDDTAGRIATPGAFGASGDNNVIFEYDNFTATWLE